MLNRLIDIADKRQACISNDLSASGETTICHEIFHDLDRILVIDCDARDFIKRYSIPESDQSDLPPRVVVEERGFGCLATTDECGVGREFTEEVRFTCSARTKLNKVEVRFHERCQPCNEVELQTLREFRGLEPD